MNFLKYTIRPPARMSCMKVDRPVDRDVGAWGPLVLTGAWYELSKDTLLGLMGIETWKVEQVLEALAKANIVDVKDGTIRLGTAAVQLRRCRRILENYLRVLLTGMLMAGVGSFMETSALFYLGIGVCASAWLSTLLTGVWRANIEMRVCAQFSATASPVGAPIA